MIQLRRSRWLRLGSEVGSLSIDLGPGWNLVRPQLLGVILLLAANLAIFLGVTWPRWSSIAAVDTASREGVAAQAALRPALERARRMYGRVLDAESEVTELRERIGGGAVSEVVSTLRAAVDAAGLGAARIGYAVQPVPELGLMQLQIDLPLRGSYGQLRRFLDEVLAGPMFVVLERIGASTPSFNDPTGQLLLSTTASVFVRAADDSAEPSMITTSPIETGEPLALASSLASRLQRLPAIPLLAEELELRLEQLDTPLPAKTQTRRNLFAFPTQVTAAEPDPEEALAALASQFTPDPVTPFQLIGVTRTRDGLLATLSGGDDLVLLVRRGELLPDGYRVAHLDLTSVELEAGNETTRLSLRRDENPGVTEQDR